MFLGMLGYIFIYSLDSSVGKFNPNQLIHLMEPTPSLTTDILERETGGM